MTGRTRTYRGPAGTGVAYGVAAALVALSPLFYIPAVTRTLGAAGFRDLAVGQSIGAAAAVFIGLGLVFTGPAAVARSSDADRATFLRAALGLQCLIAAIVCPAALAVAFLLAQQYRVDALLVTLATAVLGMFPTWFIVGMGRGTWLIAYDAVPKVVGAGTGALLVIVTSALWVLPLAQLVFSAAAHIALLRATRGSRGPVNTLSLLRQSRDTLRSQRAPFIAQVCSSVYMNLPVTLMAAVAAPGISSFAAGDRYLRLAVAATGPVTQVFQGWTPHPLADPHVRMRTTVKVHAAIAVAGATLLVAAKPLVEAILFGDAVTLSYGVVIPLAITFAAIVLSRAIGTVCLPTLGFTRPLATSALAGAVVGAPCIMLLGAHYGASGGAIGVLIAEVTVLTWQGLSFRTRLRDAVRAQPMLVGRHE